MRIWIIFGSILIVTVLHYTTPPSLFLWHNIFQRLYYLPIVYAAVSFGVAGGLGSALCSGVCYLPHILFDWRGSPGYTENQLAEVVVFVLVGWVTGVLADQERRRRLELELTAQQLKRVYRELQTSLEQVKRADRLSAVGQLAAGLAHEVRNPLASIEGAIDIVERDSTGERRAEFLAIIKMECRRLNRLLTNLLDFARPRPPQVESVAVESLIDPVLALASHTAGTAAIVLRKILPPGLSPVQGDPEQLKQVILNLTLNAIQAMPEGGEIALSARRDGERIGIEVSDEGTGIPEEEIERIFDPFYTTKDTGTGLGLAVAYQIIAQHHGRITARRNPARGMTFSIWLPLVQPGAGQG
jgi:signal transduction histidine kinase